ncbi:MAG: ATP-binding cassette domain-containing protein [Candidatus Marinimicrobia bacterium]|nr:ATP-binding cassette domain-containing protein [Candidatus Neomarinimicrobiota bacterium]
MIHVENLSKHFGEVNAIQEIDFTVNDGEILGFLGPNGAGKTTTLRIITTFLTPSGGRVTVDDLDVAEHSAEIRKRIGYLPELNPLYDEMLVYEQLRFVAESRNIVGRWFTEALHRVIDVCGIKEVIHRPVGELSKGYRQRVGLAMAIIHDPDILILDEPSAGLDPNQIVEIRELIKQLGREKTVIMSSHILQEVQEVADRMVILNNGQVVADGTTAELMAGFEGKASLNLDVKSASEASVTGLTRKFTDIKVRENSLHDGHGHLLLEYSTGHDLREQIFHYAVESGWIILEMSRTQAKLEDLFRKLTIENGGPHA